MCGIFVSIGNEISIDKCNELSQKIKHRGPESTQVIIRDDFIIDGIKQRVYMCFHRLSIFDQSSSGMQPFNHDGAYLLINGDIYNSTELTQKYDIELSSYSDCEIVLQLYIKFNRDLKKVIELLDGVFSIVLVDFKINTFFVSRDTHGVRSLYHSNNLFSSELKSCPNGQQFQPGTLQRNKAVFKLSELNCFNSIARGNNAYGVSSNFCHKKLLENSIAKRVHGDRKIACLLSGGLDSSIVAFLLSQKIKDLHTFSIGFENSPDILAARKMSNFIKSNHHEVVVTPKQLLDFIPTVVEKIESYDVTTVRASTPMYFLCKYISTHHPEFKILFSGEGSDECNGSYKYFDNAPCSPEFNKECNRLIKDIHFFDGLRADKCISGNGLESRIPFLDKEYVNSVLCDESKYEKHKIIEKYKLRNAFNNYIPDDILNRKKEAFSDGISKTEKSWFDYISDYVNENGLISEKEWYKSIYDLHYSNDTIPYYWLPKWCGDLSNPSARTI